MPCDTQDSRYETLQKDFCEYREKTNFRLELLESQLKMHQSSKSEEVCVPPSLESRSCDQSNRANAQVPAPPKPSKLALSESTADDDSGKNSLKKKDQTSRVPLDPSMWDAALLVGLQGHACAVWAVLAFLLNVAVQATLVGIIMYYMAPDKEIDEDTVAAFRCVPRP